MDELKPCPFCGEIPELIYLDNYGYCYYCGDTHIGTHYCETGNNKTGAEAIRHWNTRPAEDALKAEVKRLEAVIAEIGAMTLTGMDDVEDCWREWLNAPADCVKQNGKSAKQPDLCCKSKKESEVKNG